MDVQWIAWGSCGSDMVGRKYSEDSEQVSGCMGRRKHKKSLDHAMLGPKRYEQTDAYTS